jgi:hypothetical protein
MAVLDGHHDASDPAGPGTTTALVQACSGHRRVRTGDRTRGRAARAHRGRPAGGGRTPRPVAPAVPVARVLPPGGHAGSTGSAKWKCPTALSARPPTSTRSPRWRSILPSDGSTTPRPSSTRPPTPWRAASPAPSDGSSRSMPQTTRLAAAPATRRGTPSSSRRSRRPTGSSDARAPGGRARPRAAAPGGRREPTFLTSRTHSPACHNEARRRSASARICRQSGERGV